MRRRWLWLWGVIPVLCVLAWIYSLCQMDPVPGQLRIGVTYMTMNNEFYKSLHSEISRIADENEDVIEVRDPELDEKKQSQQIDAFRQKKMDIIVINPVRGDSPVILAALKRARQAGIKIIAVDTQLKHFEVDASVVSDNYQAGVLVAQDLIKREQQGRILLLEHNGTVSADMRIRGFKDTIQSHSNFRIVSEEETQGQTEKAMPAVRQVIREGVDFDTLVALNDRSAIGGLAAMKEQGVTRSVAIYGIDGSPDMKSLLKSTEDVTGTVAQSPMQMGVRVMQIIEAMRQGKTYQAEEVIPVELITKDNIEQFDVNGWQ